jgi:ribose transport system substrate-binding protein
VRAIESTPFRPVARGQRRLPDRDGDPKGFYFVPVLSKALDIFELLQNEQGPLALESIHQRTNIAKTTVYRILKTFVRRGYVAQSQHGLYRLVSHPKKVRFGFGSESAEMPFSEAVTDSLKAASSAAGVDLIVLDNRYDGPTALHNADEFVRNRVDLVIEFQIDQHVAPGIALVRPHLPSEKRHNQLLLAI